MIHLTLQQYLARRLYTYDPLGNITTLVATTTTGIATSTYAYDELDRLTREAVTATNATTTLISKYGYTAIGNIASTTKHTTIATYSYEGNQGTSYANPHAVTKVRVGGGDKAFTYDRQGNLTYDPLAVLNNSWTFRNELDTITSLTMYTTLRYEAASRRVYLNREELPNNGPQGVGGEDPVTVRYPTVSYTDNATDAEKYIHIEGGTMSLGTVERTATTTRTFRTSADHLGSTRLVTNPSKEIVETADYEAFGSLATSTSEESFTEDRKFTSHEFDEGTEYTYAKARYLNTDVGRFISQDPKFVNNPEAFLEDPQQQNSYTYARNNPVKFVDPNGESATLVGAIAGAAYGIGYSIGHGGSWNSIAHNIVSGTTKGALIGSVIDTGGLSLPAVALILRNSSFVDIGVDAVDAGIKNRASPEKFTSQEKKDAVKEVIKDAVKIAAGVKLSDKASVVLDTLTTLMDKLDQYFGDDIYKNVNKKYQENSGPSYSGPSVNGGSSGLNSSGSSWGRSKNPVGFEQNGAPIYCWGSCPQ